MGKNYLIPRNKKADPFYASMYQFSVIPINVNNMACDHE